MALSPTTATANQRASWLPARTPRAAIGCTAPEMVMTQPQTRRSPTTYRVPAMKMCELAMAAMPSSRLKNPMTASRTAEKMTRPRPRPSACRPAAGVPQWIG
jgi:hypothetical protein